MESIQRQQQMDNQKMLLSPASRLTRLLSHLSTARHRPLFSTLDCSFSSSSSASASSSDSGSKSKESDKSESKSKSYFLHKLHDKSDAEVVDMVLKGDLSQYKLEQELKKSIEKGAHPDCARAVRIRRLWLSKVVDIKAGEVRDSAVVEAPPAHPLTSTSPVSPESPAPVPSVDKPGGMAASGDANCQHQLDSEENLAVHFRRWGLPFAQFDYESFYRKALGKNCENVIGYVPVPVGFVGPMDIDGRSVLVPLATTEGALLASVNRGCRAITESGGVKTDVYNDGMTRAPVVRLSTAERAVEFLKWVQSSDGFGQLKSAFEKTTSFGKLLDIKPILAGRTVFLRFRCSTGDAMGMNMISKGVLKAMSVLETQFPDLQLVSVSGNVCTDKKPSAINFIEGRGKSVVAEVVLKGSVIVNVLKCTVKSMVDVNVTKNLLGSSMAGSIGGNNAHAANIVAACFLATGQDIAQVVESSNCVTLMESANDGVDLRVSVTLPCLEVGTIGGGTTLPAQNACLQMLGVAGATPQGKEPGTNSRQLARIISGAVLAGEISLMAALASQHLVSAHMTLNR